MERYEYAVHVPSLRNSNETVIQMGPTDSYADAHDFAKGWNEQGNNPLAVVRVRRVEVSSWVIPMQDRIAAKREAEGR